MRRAATQSTALLVLLLVACATTAAVDSARYWTARQSFVDTQETWNDLLRLDNDRIRAGKDPLFSQRDREVALAITRLAYEAFEEIEPMLGDSSRSAEIILGISKVNTLAFQLALLYAGSQGGP